MSGRRWNALLGIIIAVAVGIRVIMALMVDGILGPDAGRYHAQALWLLQGQGFQLTNTAPIYPFVVAGIYHLFGVQNGLSVQLAQAVCWGGAVGLIGLIGRRLFGVAAGLLAAAYAAVYPPFIQYQHYAGSVYYGTENLFMLFILLMIWWLVIDKRLTMRHVCFAGVSLGLATLTRSISLAFPAAVAVWWLCRRPLDGPRRWIKPLLVFCISMGAVILPWTIRNYVVYRTVVPVIPYSGFSIWGGNHPYTNGQFIDARGRPEYQYFQAIEDPVEQDHAYIRETVAFWRASTPASLATLAAKKFYLFWTDFGAEYNVFYGMMVPFSWLGLWLTRRHVRALILHAFIFYIMFFCLVFFGEARMRLPIEPCLILLASAAVVRFVRRFPRRYVPIGILAGWGGLHLAIAWSWGALSRLINIL